MKIILLAIIACLTFSSVVQETQASWKSVTKICSKRYKTYSPEWNECCIQEVEKQVEEKKKEGTFDEYNRIPCYGAGCGKESLPPDFREWRFPTTPCYGAGCSEESLPPTPCFGYGCTQESKNPPNPFNFDESDEDVDRCDAGYFPGRAPGNSDYEVNEDCYDKCYQVCFERGINGKVPGWRTGPCRNNCEKKCNRCNKYVYDQLPKIRNCPVPECLIKDEAWNKCVNDIHSYVGGTGTEYLDRALKILRRNGISTDKYKIKYLYCRCATQGSTNEACQYFPPPMKKRSMLRYKKKRRN